VVDITEGKKAEEAMGFRAELLDAAGQAIVALGNRKDVYFGEQLAENGALVFVDTAQLIDALRLSGKRLAVVSASQNCEAVLRRVGLLDRFNARVTGVDRPAGVGGEAGARHPLEGS
jgi:beta-phosphoglucomutase-like phosphatase (HAD superfamily)